MLIRGSCSIAKIVVIGLVLDNSWEARKDFHWKQSCSARVFDLIWKGSCFGLLAKRLGFGIKCFFCQFENLLDLIGLELFFYVRTSLHASILREDAVESPAEWDGDGEADLVAAAERGGGSRRGDFRRFQPVKEGRR